MHFSSKLVLATLFLRIETHTTQLFGSFVPRKCFDLNKSSPNKNIYQKNLRKLYDMHFPSQKEKKTSGKKFLSVLIAKSLLCPKNHFTIEDFCLQSSIFCFYQVV